MIDPSRSPEQTPCPVRHRAITTPNRIAIHAVSPQLSPARCPPQQPVPTAGTSRSTPWRSSDSGGARGAGRCAAGVGLRAQRRGVLPAQPRLSSRKQRELAVQLDADAFWSAGEIPAGNWQPLCLDFTHELPASEETWPLESTQLNNMILTSGSSGTPKAVVHRLCNHRPRHAALPPSSPSMRPAAGYSPCRCSMWAATPSCFGSFWRVRLWYWINVNAPQGAAGVPTHHSLVSGAYPTLAPAGRGF